MSTNSENLVKIGAVLSEIAYLVKYAMFCDIVSKSSNFSPRNLWRYWTKIHQMCTRCRGIIGALKLFISVVIFQSFLECQGVEWRSVCQCCSKRIMKYHSIDEWLNSAYNLSTFCVAWQRPLRNLKNGSGLITFTQISTIWWEIVKIGIVDSEIVWLKFLKKRKKLMQAKIIACPASLPSRLKLKFHGSSFPRSILMTSSWGCHKEATRKTVPWNWSLNEHRQYTDNKTQVPSFEEFCRPRSRGDNTFGSVCVCACVSVCCGHSPV